jgi:NTE family protein
MCPSVLTSDPQAPLSARRPRLALALSGGGFRASVFHLGVLRRLAELGRLSQVDVISTVSGGSIVGAFAALRWQDMLEAGGDWPALERHIVRPFLDRIQSGNFILAWLAALPGALLRRRIGAAFSRTAVAADLYDEWFFEKVPLDRLPASPLLILNASSLPSIRAWRFSREGMGDSRYGYAKFTDPERTPRVSLAVSASAAFPPVFTPVRVRLDRHVFSRPFYGETRPGVGKEMPISDGGVYDNLALEVLTRNQPIPAGLLVPPPETLVVSDAGRPAVYRFTPSSVPLVGAFKLLGRAREIALEQVAAQRRRALIDDFRQRRDGTSGILVGLSGGTDHLSPGHRALYLSAVGAQTQIPKALLALIRSVRTSLDRFSPIECEALMYHAYTVTDASWWSHLGATAPPQNPPWSLVFDSARIAGWGRGLAHSGEVLRLR